MKSIARPLFIVLTGIAVLGFLIQILYPNLYFDNQEALRDWVSSFEPFDRVAFVFLQALQVIITPISHYVLGLLGGAVYGVWEGFILNWSGRMIGHIAAYWIGFYFGAKVIAYFFDEKDFNAYKRFINGTPETLHLRLGIFFIILFLPLFPDDEISYLVGVAALPFRYYLPVLALGHIGGSIGLAYIGAGIDTRDSLFWIIFFTCIVLAALLVFAVRSINRVAVANSKDE